jgi:hypothetical protein
MDELAIRLDGWLHGFKGSFIIRLQNMPTLFLYYM